MIVSATKQEINHSFQVKLLLNVQQPWIKVQWYFKIMLEFAIKYQSDVLHIF